MSEYNVNLCAISHGAERNFDLSFMVQSESVRWVICIFACCCHRWARLLKQPMSITVNRLPAKENKLPFSVCSKQTEVYIYSYR